MISKGTLNIIFSGFGFGFSLSKAILNSFPFDWTVIAIIFLLSSINGFRGRLENGI